jgi:hypothetical protein
MIDGKYATSPLPQPFQTETQEYETHTTQKAGKGKNTRTIKTTVKHNLAYTVISYEFCRERHHRLTEKEEQELEHAKRQNRLLHTVLLQKM